MCFMVRIIGLKEALQQLVDLPSNFSKHYTCLRCHRQFNPFIHYNLSVGVLHDQFTSKQEDCERVNKAAALSGYQLYKDALESK